MSEFDTTKTVMQCGKHLIEGLQDPLAYEHPVSSVHMTQTHTAWVLLTGNYAYKIKKPVDFGFLDFSTLAKRHHWCEEEVRLNRRFAPDLYLGVVEIRGSVDCPHLGGHGPLIEYAVRMRQFPDNNLLSELAEQKRLESSHIDQLIEQISGFHKQANRAAPGSVYGKPELVHRWVSENYRQISPHLHSDEERLEMDCVHRWTNEQHKRLESFIESRKQNGFIRECHGDLHLRNLTLIDGKVTAFDCIEFNPELRWIDVISEVAFLVMDLDERGYTAFANRFQNGYLQHTGDYEGLKLLPYYIVYRALVRAKVAILRRQQALPASQDYKESTAEYRHYMQFAERHLDRETPQLLITHGLSGSGKSTLARQLSHARGIIQVRSDIERKRLYGLEPGARTESDVDAGLYCRERTNDTYHRLAECAASILEAGYSVLLDATFLQETQRDLMQEVAEKRQVRFLILDCAAADAILEKRVRMRETKGKDASEATLKVLNAEREKAQPLRDDERQLALTVDTSQNDYLQTTLRRLFAERRYGRPLL